MKMPWRNQTGLARLAAVSAAVFIIASGLCGVNLVVTSYQRDYPGTFILLIGVLELVAMILSAGALIIIGLVALFKTVFRRTRTEENLQ